MATLRKRASQLIGIVLIGMGVVIAFSVYRVFNPTDVVSSHIVGIPPNTAFICVVVQTEGGGQPLEWSLKKVFPFTMHPDRCTVSFLSEGQSEHRGNVQWVESIRTGVLRRSSDYEWSVYWFDPPRAQPTTRFLNLGGGSLRLNLAEADSREVLTKDQARALGMDYALTSE